MTGYALREAIVEVLGHFWRESFGQIYPILQKLEAEGLVACVGAEGRGRRQSRKYAITETGQEAFAYIPGFLAPKGDSPWVWPSEQPPKQAWPPVSSA